MKRILLASIATLLFSSVHAKTEILCDTYTTAKEGEILHQKYLSLMNRGYRQEGKEFTKKQARSFVGIGLLLKDDIDKGTHKITGTVAVGPAVKGLPVEKTGMFDDPTEVYRVKAVDGISASGLGIEAVRDMILGKKIPGSSVVVTFSRYNSDRSFDRYFERTRMSYPDGDVLCQRFVLSKKK